MDEVNPQKIDGKHNIVNITHDAVYHPFWGYTYLPPATEKLLQSFLKWPPKLEGWDPVNQFNHTSWVAVVTPTDRPKSVRNHCVIKVFGDVFV